jgi:hypothetical protein
MPTVTFQILEGIDKGRVFRDLPTPVTIGREEGNMLRLNDERVSRFHAKVQHDNGDIILTDLESTNGTRVNNNVVQIRRLRPGDRIYVGRSQLLFGSNEEILARMHSLGMSANPGAGGTVGGGSLLAQGPATIQAQTFASDLENEGDFDLNFKDEISVTADALLIGNRRLPALPQKLTPSQAARLAEIIDFLHRGLSCATDHIRANDEGTQISLNYADWQKILSVQMLLARYLRAIAEPDALDS